MIRLQDWKLAGHQHLDAKRVMRRFLECHVVADQSTTPQNAQRGKLFSVSDFAK